MTLDQGGAGGARGTGIRAGRIGESPKGNVETAGPGAGTAVIQKGMSFLADVPGFHAKWQADAWADALDPRTKDRPGSRSRRAGRRVPPARARSTTSRYSDWCASLHTRGTGSREILALAARNDMDCITLGPNHGKRKM